MGNLYWNDSDPMEKRIRKTLQEWEASPASSWDSPSDDLWEKISTGTTEPKSIWTTRKWWLFPSVSILVAASIFFLIKQPRQLKITRTTSTHTIAAEQSSSNEQVNTVEILNTGKSFEAKGPHASDITLIIPKKEFSENSPGLEITDAISKTPQTPYLGLALNYNDIAGRFSGGIPVGQLNLNEPNSAITPVVTPEKGGSESDMQVGPDNNNAISNREKTPQDSGNTIPGLSDFSIVSPLPITSEMLEFSSAAFKPSAPTMRRAPSDSRIFAGITFAQNLGYRNIQSNRPFNILPPFLRENESASWTTEMGIRIGFRPSSRFALSGGMSLYNVGLQSQFRIRVQFDPGRENPSGNDNSESNYALSVPSAYGDATVEVGLRRPNHQQITPGQNISVEMRTHLNLQYISVPVNAYYFPVSGRFSLGLKAGIAFNMLQKQQFSAKTTVMERGLGTRTVTVTPRFDPLEKVIPELHVGAAIWYRPSAGWMVSLEPSYRNSLKPAITREFFSVSQYAFGVQIGVQKFF